MSAIKKGKATGFYFVVFAGIMAVISAFRYGSWATANDVLNSHVLLALIVGIIVNVVLVFYDNDFLVIAMTALYSIAMIQLLVDSVGSLVDAFQGIVMFGDPTQVGAILSISGLMGLSILATIVAGFMTRVSE